MRQKNLSYEEAVQKLLTEPFQHQVFLKIIQEKTDAHLETAISESVFELAIVYGQPLFRSVANNGHVRICSRWFTTAELSRDLHMPDVTTFKNYIIIPAHTGVSVPPFRLFEKQVPAESKSSFWEKIFG